MQGWCSSFQEDAGGRRAAAPGQQPQVPGGRPLHHRHQPHALPRDFQKAGLPIPSACAADRRSCYAMVPRQLLRIASELAPLSLSLFGFVFGVTLAPRFRVSISHHGYFQ